MALPELQKFKKRRSGPKRFMKLFVVVKDNHILHLKKRIKLAELGRERQLNFEEKQMFKRL